MAMTKPAFARLAFCAVLPLSLLACHESPPTATEVRSAISSDLGNVLRASGAALAGAPDALPSTAAFEIARRLLGNPALAPLQTMAAQLTDRTGDTAAPTIDADAQVAYLNDTWFTDANHLGDGIFQLPASVVCARTITDASGTRTEAIDAACVTQLTRSELRIRADHEDGGLVLALQVGSAHDEPLRLTITHASLALTLDLDEAQHAFAALGAVSGDLPNVKLEGEATAKLEALGPASARVSFAIDRAIWIEAAPAGQHFPGVFAYELASAKADVASFTLDATAKTVSLRLGLGPTRIVVPASDATPRIELVLPGLTFSTSFAPDQPLTFDNVGLGNGSARLTLDDGDAVVVTVNRGGAFDVTLSRDAIEGTHALAVSPPLDLEILVDHAVIGDAAPVYDVRRLQLSGSVRGHDGSPQLEVVTGALAIQTNPERYGFTAATGQCVTSSDASDPTTGAPFTQWTVGACL